MDSPEIVLNWTQRPIPTINVEDFDSVQIQAQAEEEHEIDQKVSEVSNGTEVTTLWVLKDWEQKHEKLIEWASCGVKADFSCNNETAPVECYFTLGYSNSTNYNDPRCGPLDVTTQYLSLWASIFRRTVPYLPVAFNLTTDAHLPGIANLKDQYVSMKFHQDFCSKMVAEKFLPYKIAERLAIQEKDLKIKMCVVPLNLYSTPIHGFGDVPSTSSLENEHPTPRSTLLGSHLESMYDSDDNLFDVELEMKDGTVLGAHRFVLSGKSASLKELIEEEVENPDFNGIIKIGNVSGKPMQAILHWMYTGDIPVSGDTFQDLGEVLKAARDLGIPDEGLKEDVDRKLVEICTSENMHELFPLAKENGLENATAKISQLITDFRKLCFRAA